MSRPFKVINCLSQGFAVAGPAGGDSADAPRAVDLEMVQWGMAADKAVDLAAKLNGQVRRSAETPLHRHD